MTGSARTRVLRAERLLRAAALVSSVLRAVAGALLILLLATLLDASVAVPAGLRRLVPTLALGVGLLILARRLRRSGALRQNLPSAALWIESRFPSLRYALVTVVDPTVTAAAPVLERQVAEVLFEPVVRRAVRRSVSAPALATLAGVLALFALPGGVVARIVRPRGGDALGRLSAASSRNPLATIVVRVLPPAYAGLGDRSLDDPATVRALVGSSIVVEGREGTESVRATFSDRTQRSTVNGDRWSISLAAPAAALAVHLRAGSHERLLVIDPIPDSVPVVTLSSPARDSIYRRPSGRVQLTASVADDLGLAGGSFEYIISSGGGETFTFRSGRVGAATFNGREGVLTASLSLDSLELNPGDIVHLRAVARDRNTVNGPGVGASETRTLRIARTDEFDSVAVEGAPPSEPERDALSQRMLLMLTEALEKKRPSLARGTLMIESREIAVDQTLLRKRVGEIVFARLGETGGEEGNAVTKRLEHPVNADSLLAAADRANSVLSGAALEGVEDETAVVAINRPLLVAYNHMWSASSELEIGQPAKAIPWMRKALDALQAARSAERIYLRGRARPVVVDVERVRLAGKERGTPVARFPLTAADPAHLTRLARFDLALTLARSAPAAAADTLLLLRIDLLDRDPPAAAALDAAANALRRPGDPTLSLIRARRALAGSPPRRAALSTWGSPW